MRAGKQRSHQLIVGKLARSFLRVPAPSFQRDGPIIALLEQGSDLLKLCDMRGVVIEELSCEHDTQPNKKTEPAAAKKP